MSASKRLRYVRDVHGPSIGDGHAHAIRPENRRVVGVGEFQDGRDRVRRVSTGFGAEPRENEGPNPELQSLTHHVHDRLVPDEHERAVGDFRQFTHRRVDVLTEDRFTGRMHEVCPAPAGDSFSNDIAPALAGPDDNDAVGVDQAGDIPMGDALFDERYFEGRQSSRHQTPSAWAPKEGAHEVTFGQRCGCVTGTGGSISTGDAVRKKPAR